MIGVVADAAGHRVDAGAADERVVPGGAVEKVRLAVTDQVIVESVTVALDRRSEQLEGLDVRAERVVEGGVDIIVSLVLVLDDDVADIVDVIGVLAEAADQRVDAGAAIEELSVPLPVIVLASSLPVPSISWRRSRTRFSTLAVSA